MLPPIGLERPANPDHGDWASNAAMQLAPVARAAPIRIAETLLEHFERPASVAEVSVAAPGFLNFRLDPGMGGGPGRPDPRCGRRRTAAGPASEPRRINVEFVSANPTGPLTRRQRARRIRRRRPVARPGGRRPRGRRASTTSTTSASRSQTSALIGPRDPKRATDSPKTAIAASTSSELAAAVPDELSGATPRPPTPDRGRAGSGAGRRNGAAGRDRGQPRRGSASTSTCGRRRAPSTRTVGWSAASSSLRDSGLHLRPRRARPGSARRPSATTRIGSIIRSNGRPTYFAADIGYVSEKFSRGFDELIYVWGEDHHGTVARLRARGHRARATTPRPSACSSIAWVRFVRDGEARSRMSKRSGEFITLDDLLDEVGADAARWYFSSRAYTTRHRLRPRARQAPEQREPRLLRAVRARPRLVDPPQRRRGRRSRPTRRGPRSC